MPVYTPPTPGTIIKCRHARRVDSLTWELQLQRPSRVRALYHGSIYPLDTVTLDRSDPRNLMGDSDVDVAAQNVRLSPDDAGAYVGPEKWPVLAPGDVLRFRTLVPIDSLDVVLDEIEP